MKGRKYVVVIREGEKYRGETEFFNYHEAYRYCQARLEELAEEEYQIDDPDHYYYSHYFLVAELWKLTLRENVFGDKVWQKFRSLYFYWTGRRVTFSPGNKPKFSFEKIQKIEERLNRGEDVEELVKEGEGV